jgi:hypothetical protein
MQITKMKKDISVSVREGEGLLAPNCVENMAQQPRRQPSSYFLHPFVYKLNLKIGIQ